MPSKMKEHAKEMMLRVCVIPLKGRACEHKWGAGPAQRAIYLGAAAMALQTHYREERNTLLTTTSDAYYSPTYTDILNKLDITNNIIHSAYIRERVYATHSYDMKPRNIRRLP